MSDNTTVIESVPQRRSNAKRYIIISVIFILFILLAALIYFYFSLLRPKTAAEKLELKGYEFVRNIYGPTADDPFDRPHYVATDKDSNIYVADSGKGRIVKFDRNGRFLRTFGKKTDEPPHGDTKDLLQTPLGVSVADNGDVVIADRNMHKVVVVDANGNYKKSWQVMMPLIPKVVDNKIYLTTYGPFYIYDMEGNELVKWGKRGQLPETFDFPNGIEVDKKGNIYIADSNNNQIKAFTPNGTLMYAIGKKRTKPIDPEVDFDLLQGLTFDELGLLYSVDAFGFNIRVLSHLEKSPIQIVTSFGSDGSRDGEFTYPAGIAYLGDREFAVADEGNNRVQIIRIPVSEDMKKAADDTKTETAVPPPGKSILKRVFDILKRVFD